MAKSRAISTGTIPIRRRVKPAPPPAWIKPQLAKLVEKAPDGPDWLHEIKLDGYRMHARLDAGRVKIITRRGNDWTQKYPAIANAIAGLPAQDAYLDGELCGVLPDGRTAFNLIQNAADASQGSLVFFLFDLLFQDGEDIRDLPLVDRKTRLEAFLVGAPESLRYNDHQIGQGPAFHRLACKHGLEGIVSKRIDGRYEPDRRTWLKTKCLNREEFVVVGWSDPEGSRHRIGALLLGYYTPEGKLVYAGRVGTGMPVAELERLYGRLQPLAIPKMPLSEPPPRGGRFGSPLVYLGCIGCARRWLSKSAMSNGRRTVYSGMWSIWVNARTSPPSRCAATRLTPANRSDRAVSCATITATTCHTARTSSRLVTAGQLN
jgi:DNA ligase D-like protein (predicted ligase)